MGTKISDKDSSKFAPTAYLREEGAMLKGILVGARTAQTQFGEKLVYSVQVEDATCRFMDADKAEVKPPKGTIVNVMPPTRLATQLSKVATNSMVTIKYLGLGKARKGKAPHTFDVEVE